MTAIAPVKTGTDIQSTFFDMWRQEHPYADLQDIPGDLVTTSGSGLDPDITLENAEYQMDRISGKWAQDLKRDPAQVRVEIEQIVQQQAFAPMYGLWGEKIVNVLGRESGTHQTLRRPAGLKDKLIYSCWGTATKLPLCNSIPAPRGI